MQNKKVTMLAAVLAVTVIAMAGVGYALVSYTATTTNTNNDIVSTYLEVSQDGAAYTNDFFKDFYYDTVTTGEYNQTTEKFDETVTYTPVWTGKYAKAEGAENGTYIPNGTTAPEGAVNAVLISKALNLTIKPENAADDQTAKLDVTVKNRTLGENPAEVAFTPAGDMTFIMILSNGETQLTADYSNGWHFTGLPVSEEITYAVSLIMILDGDSVTTPDTGFGDGVVDKSEFNFILTANVA